MTFENDDKTYNVLETLSACETEGIPMVLDYHHYIANQGGIDLAEIFIKNFPNMGKAKFNAESPSIIPEIREGNTITC